MKTSKELLEKNGWELYGCSSNFDKTYRKELDYGYICVIALRGSMNNVVIDMTEFNSYWVEPDFLRKVLEEVYKLEVKNDEN